MHENKPSTPRLIAAFTAIYLIWGSTYLAIRYAIQTMPPLLMASVRFAIGGAALYTWSRLRGAPPGTSKGWRRAFLIGAMLLFVGNGGVVLAEQWVASGLTAVIISTVPLWVALLGWLRPGGHRPSRQVILGILIGMTGVMMLIGVGNLRGAGTVDPTGATLLVLSSISWAAGSLYAQTVSVSDSPWQTSAMQMIAGGLFLFIAAVLHGEVSQFRPTEVSATSVLALMYLMVFGSIVAFTAYSWLIKATTPSRLATYAYVNPAVAVVLGWLIANEPLTPRMVVSMCLIVAAVMVITTTKR